MRSKSATALKEIAARLGIGLVYKTSFDKANRTSVSAARGIGLDAGAADLCRDPLLARPARAHRRARGRAMRRGRRRPSTSCRSRRSCAGRPICCVAAAATGKVVNVKKGQFLAPWDMANVVAKITGAGNPNVLVTERGASFGYNTLVVGHARAADPGAHHRRASHLRRHPFGAAAGRQGHLIGR